MNFITYFSIKYTTMLSSQKHNGNGLLLLFICNINFSDLWKIIYIGRKVMFFKKLEMEFGNHSIPGLSVCLMGSESWLL